MEKRRESLARKSFPCARAGFGRILRQFSDAPPVYHNPLYEQAAPYLRRPPAVSGIFYPESGKAVARQLAAWNVQDGSESFPRGGQEIIAPHAAWEISGAASAAAFAAVQAHPAADSPAGRVFLIGPCHSPGESGIYLSESDAFQTPLGDLPVDRRINGELRAAAFPFVEENDLFHLAEHSLEVLLPMVKYCFPAAHIVPILVQGGADALKPALSKVFNIIFKYMDESLLVISSNAAASKDPAHALSMADGFSSLLHNRNSGAFRAGLDEGRISACGGSIIAALLDSGLLGEKHFSSLLPLSGHTGDDGQTVCYGAFTAL